MHRHLGTYKNRLPTILSDVEKGVSEQRSLLEEKKREEMVDR